MLASGVGGNVSPGLSGEAWPPCRVQVIRLHAEAQLPLDTRDTQGSADSQHQKTVSR